MDLEPRDQDGSIVRFAKNVGYGVAVDLAKTVVLFAGGSFLALAVLVVVAGGSVPAWAALLAVFIVALVLLVLRGRAVKQLKGQVRSIEADRDEHGEMATIFVAALERHEAYSGHVAQALDALQRIVSGDIDIAIPHYIEAGVLEPARDLITDKPAEHIRLSVLLPSDDGEHWWMPWAAGHTLTGKAKYGQRIVDTLARFAFETGEPQKWEDVNTDSGFRQNPQASHPTNSMISLPIMQGDEVLGVFNIVSSEAYAFDPAEETYLASLGAVIAVAVGVFLKEQGHSGPNSE